MTRWLEAALKVEQSSDKIDKIDKIRAEEASGTDRDSEKAILSIKSILSDEVIASASAAQNLPCQHRSDMDLYADALRLHGPMSYGMAMERLRWGATRAGQAETALREAGRIRFNKQGRAVLLETTDIPEQEQG